MNVLTFDVEDWFHVLDNDSTRTEKEWSGFASRINTNIDRILDLLVERRQRATFFCLGWIGAQYPEVIRRIDKMGHEIGSHSFAHQLVYQQSPDAYQNDLERSIKTLEDITGKKIRTYRAPGFSLSNRTPWIFDILSRNGIEIDASVLPIKGSHGDLEGFGFTQPSTIAYQGIVLKELPMNAWRFFGMPVVFSGGGYFRLLPYALIHRLMRESNYVMTYFHPRDFDAFQPIIRGLNWYRIFKSYYGLPFAFNKLRRLLEDFAFVDVDTIDKHTDWNSVPRVDMARIAKQGLSSTKEKLQ